MSFWSDDMNRDELNKSVGLAFRVIPGVCCLSALEEMTTWTVEVCLGDVWAWRLPKVFIKAETLLALCNPVI